MQPCRRAAYHSAEITCLRLTVTVLNVGHDGSSIRPLRLNFFNIDGTMGSCTERSQTDGYPGPIAFGFGNNPQLQVPWDTTRVVYDVRRCPAFEMFPGAEFLP